MSGEIQAKKLMAVRSLGAFPKHAHRENFLLASVTESFKMSGFPAYGA